MLAMEVCRAIPTEAPTPPGLRIALAGSRSVRSGTVRRRPVALLCAWAAVLVLAGCGGGEEGTEPAVGLGNAAQIRADYAEVDPARAAAFEAYSNRTGNGVNGQSGTSMGSQALVSAAGYPVRGDEGAGSSPDATSSSTTTTTGTAATPAVTDAGSGSPTSVVTTGTTGQVTAASADRTSTAFAVEALAAINAARAQSRVCGDIEYPPVPPLKWNARAAFAALLEVEWMQRDNAFGHEWPTGEHVWHRLAMAGYDWMRADENIAAGFRTLDSAMKAWIDSPSHCKALMRADVVDVGVAVIPGETRNTYLSYWAMVLAAAR